jgi:cold shock CspA family protein
MAAVSPVSVHTADDPNLAGKAMARNYLYGLASNAAKRGGKPPRPAEPASVPARGRIVRLQIGQGHGYIRLADDRDIYFHRSDLLEGTSINDLDVGDDVTFRLLDDAVSGARALAVTRPRRA